MDQSPEVSTSATGGSMDLVMDSVGLSRNVVEWPSVSFRATEPRKRQIPFLS